MSKKNSAERTPAPIKSNIPNEPLIEQPKLSDKCPCNSEKEFGSCCGGQFDCDCGSHWMASECCYSGSPSEAK